MSFAFARSRYRKADTIAQENVSQPYDVVQVTLKELTRSLAALAHAQEHNLALPPDHINRALTAIYILQSSLDFELGGELAGDLFQLYEFARYHVLKAFRAEEDARLREAADAMASIHSAWAEIGPKVKVAAE